MTRDSSLASCPSVTDTSRTRSLWLLSTMSVLKISCSFCPDALTLHIFQPYPLPSAGISRYGPPPRSYSPPRMSSWPPPAPAGADPQCVVVPEPMSEACSSSLRRMWSWFNEVDTNRSGHITALELREWEVTSVATSC